MASVVVIRACPRISFAWFDGLSGTGGEDIVGLVPGVPGVAAVVGLPERQVEHCIAGDGQRRQDALPGIGPVTVWRRVSERGSIMVAKQKIHVGMIHARKTVTVTADSDHFTVVTGGETIAVVPRTTTREINRYKAYAAQQPRRPR